MNQTGSPNHEWLTPAEAAEALGVKPKTMANWRSLGTGPRYSRFGRTIRYLHADLDDYRLKHLVETMG